MLEIRLNCENCNKPLDVDSVEAMICSYECTFCKSCVDEILNNVCPNCGGGFEKRPIRPRRQLVKNPPSQIKVYKPVDISKFEELRLKLVNTLPEDR